MDTIDAATLPTPVGPLSVLLDGHVICAAGFVADPGELHGRLGLARRGRAQRVRAELGAVGAALAAYFKGELDALDRLEVGQEGTDGQQRTWQALRAVPPGATVTYTALATAVGSPRAVRAAGAACGRNLVAPVVPCHRALRADGSLGGYYYGLAVKRWLLTHEGAVMTML